MPQLSRYSDQHVEQLLSDITDVLNRHNAPTDLALMVLGNMITHLLNNDVAPSQREAIALSFAEALQASIRADSAH